MRRGEWMGDKKPDGIFTCDLFTHFPLKLISNSIENDRTSTSSLNPPLWSIYLLNYLDLPVFCNLHGETSYR